MRWLFTAAAAALAFAFAAPEAHASLKLCNRTSYVIYATTAVSVGNDNTVQGWTRIAPGACRVAINGDLAASAYYVYARTSAAHLGASRAWAGAANFCTKDSDFSLHQSTPSTYCPSADMSELPFASIATHHMRSWTTTFRETPDFDSMKSAERAGLKRLLRDNGAGDIGSDKATDAALAALRKRFRLSDKIGMDGVFDALETEAMKTAAPAGYAVCNETDKAFWAALGQKKGAAWVSRGWWLVAPGSCAKTITDSVVGSKIYLRVEKSKGLELVSGPAKFCVTNIEFEIQGRERCTARGLIEAGFAETNEKGASGFAAHVSSAGLAPAFSPGTPK
jgi:uncharacterized membrane protein